MSKVYWCQGLIPEKNRSIEKEFQDGEVICDLFCGIGFMVIKGATKLKGLRCICNDWNQDAYKYTNENIKLNSV